MSTSTATRPHLLTPISAPAGAGVTYSEIRYWAVWLQVFTATDLADVMAVDREIGERGIRALVYHGICRETGDLIEGPEGLEMIVSYVPLPPGPTEHETGTPVERVVGYTDIIQARGLPVRIRTQRDLRGGMSTPGSRQKLKNRERNYQRQEDARMKRAQENQRRMEKAIEAGTWKVIKRGKKTRTFSTKDEMIGAAS